MSWLVISASEVGTSHTATAAPCQDSCGGGVETLHSREPEPLLWLFVADGAGSASMGGEGADLAIGEGIRFVTEKLARKEFGLGDTFACDLVREVRRKLHIEAEKQDRPVRDYACTFLGIVSTKTGTIAFQVGDGGIVLDTGAGLELALIPAQGEYANQTYFVTDEDAINRLQSKAYPDRALRVAAFTDGIQRLALNMATNKPQESFFTPFFAGMSKASFAHEDQLAALLQQFLASDHVNARTDDDKTLALAYWKGQWPETKLVTSLDTPPEPSEIETGQGASGSKGHVDDGLDKELPCSAQSNSSSDSPAEGNHAA
ncbi:PP2C family serine/threonine-protein phosphatase [Comamonas squillarum]|uniref:Protein phosphatase 2C domain-containing protein n=1 Tax=Comamonas squillarum TaxID=2977320 RepID=A0ABY6A4T0_9BURK|nr:PP2C family serine/threonine-protein phosphatase [Comamonas sp. PR12]UXC19965.1 protein phosphatase 2C domain-containing protein [Comamonas sp. PR12]